MADRNLSSNIKLPTAPDEYDPRDQSIVRAIIEKHWHPAIGSAGTTRPFIYAADFGVAGDDTVDDTAAAQAALTAGAAQNAIVYFGSKVVKISGPLTSNGPGILFDVVSHGASGGPGFHVTGTTGYVTRSYADIACVGTAGHKAEITSVAFPFNSSHVGQAFTLSFGTNLVADTYEVVSVSGVTATLDKDVTAGAGAGSGGIGHLDAPAMMASGIITCWHAAFYASGQKVNLVRFQNPILSTIQNCRAYNADGYGIKVAKAWDNVWHTLSAEQCGNALQYQFSVVDGGDTTNQSFFSRIQSEKANVKAVYISPNTLTCEFGVIHSEQATPTAGLDTWLLGGSRCTYGALTLAAASSPANATAHLNASNSVIHSILTIGAVDVSIQANDTLTIINPEFQGTSHVTTNQTGRVIIQGGSIANLATDVAYLRVFGAHIAALAIGFGFNPVQPDAARFTSCDIDALSSTSSLSCATFTNCKILEGNSLLRGQTVLIGGSVTCAGTLAHSSGKLEVHGAVINANLSYTNHAAIRGYGLVLAGNIACGDGGSSDVVLDDGCVITGTVANVGIPTAGAHYVGERHKHMTPASGADMGWICTAAGTPGTWAVQATAASGTTTNALSAGTHLSMGGTFNGSVARTMSTDATSANTANTIVARDGSGNIAVTKVTGDLDAAIVNVSNKIVMGSGNDIFLGNNFNGTVLVPTGYVTFKDLGGSVVRVLVG